MGTTEKVSGRRIIQVFIAPGTGNTSSSRWEKGGIVALCDDGTAWLFLGDRHNDQWKKLPPIPIN